MARVTRGTETGTVLAQGDSFPDRAHKIQIATVLMKQKPAGCFTEAGKLQRLGPGGVGRDYPDRAGGDSHCIGEYKPHRQTAGSVRGTEGFVGMGIRLTHR